MAEPVCYCYERDDGDDHLGNGTMGNPFRTHDRAMLAGIESGADTFKATFCHENCLNNNMDVFSAVTATELVAAQSITAIDTDSYSIHVDGAGGDLSGTRGKVCRFTTGNLAGRCLWVDSAPSSTQIVLNTIGGTLIDFSQLAVGDAFEIIQVDANIRRCNGRLEINGTIADFGYPSLEGIKVTCQ